MKKTCIIFDLDGTLIDSREDLATGANLMRSHFGLETFPVEQITAYVGNGARKLAERSLQGADVDLDEALKVMKGYYKEHLVDKTYMYAGVKEGLEELHKAGIPMAVITNKPTDFSIEILEHFGLAGLFTHIIGGGSEFPLKPDPASLIHVMKENSATPSESWMVGDNYTDIVSGNAAGMKICFCTYGFGKTNGNSYDFEADSFSAFAKEILS